MLNVLDGKLEFLKMVKGLEDGTYIGLKKRFDQLNGKKVKLDNEKIDLESVVNTILNKGLDEGIILYNRYKKS
jgi:RNA-directed DNA polymerase